jgi:hypothetical protein
VRGQRVPRRFVIAGCIVVALAVGVLVVRRVWIHDTARVVNATDAVDAFRHSSTAPATIAPATTGVAATIRAVDSSITAVAAATPPAPGVYRYTTSGSEHIDVLGGATHHYPTLTTVTVTSGGCGATLRWDILKERREEWQLCGSAQGVELGTNGVQLHVFFGHGDIEPFVCDHTVVLARIDRTPSPPVALDCTLMGATWKPSWEVVGPEHRSVGVTSVPVMHVRETINNNSNYFEHTVVDWWLDDHGLPIAMSCTKSSKSNSGLVGDVVYSEHYSATLESLTPMR